ncbi:MAG TPA: riboflavin synthase [Rhodothermales bacterium]|nr:riboflavin synthase [Rhodothermales bacterium]
MFTGLVEAIGHVEATTPSPTGRRLCIAAPFADELALGESVSVSGACLTVVGTDATAFEVDTVPVTLEKTTLGSLGPGDAVNLERALRAGDRLGGHFVLGHVDATGSIVEARDGGDGARTFRIAYDPAFADLLIPAGSVAVDGISLTVARLGPSDFTVALIPHTLAVTTAGTWEEGQRVNLEFDVLGKYAQRRAAVISAD